MFIIAGTKGVTSTASRGKFYCPACDTKTRYLHQQVHQAATVFFVPLAKLNLLGEYIECQQCKGTFLLDVLEYDPEEEQNKIEAEYHRALKRVMTMMMLADGEIGENEITIINEIYKEITGSDLSRADIDREVLACNKKPKKMTEYLKTVGPFLNDHGKELIIKMAYYVSIADGALDVSEELLLKKISKDLELSTSHFKGILYQLQEG